jgi:hypothetical protein
MSGLRSRDSCRSAFRNWGILPLQSQYISSLLMFIVNNIGLYYTTSQIHCLNTRRNFDLYCPHVHLIIYQRGPYYFSIKLFNHLPLNIKELAPNITLFRVALSAFLHSKSFYKIEEYFRYNPTTNLTVIYMHSITMFYIYCKCCIATVMYMGFCADLLLLYLYALF